jgi:SlyX protein
MDVTELDSRVIDLEIKITHQEELLNELNLIVASQQDIIDRLIKQIKNMQSTHSDSSTQNKSLFEQLKDEKPPHY